MTRFRLKVPDAEERAKSAVLVAEFTVDDPRWVVGAEFQLGKTGRYLLTKREPLHPAGIKVWFQKDKRTRKQRRAAKAGAVEPIFLKPKQFVIPTEQEN